MPPKILTDRRSAALPRKETPLSRRYLRILENWIPIGLEYFEDWPTRPNCGHFFGGAHWYGSDTAAPALAFAAAASSPDFDPKRAGCSKKELREIVLKSIRYLCFTHDSGPKDCIRPEKSLGNPRTWGTKWGERGRGFFPESQCGTNIALLGVTALLIGDIVDDETWTLLARVHADYAERFGTMAPKSGVYTNTQMEENGWTSTGLASVECLLSNSPKAATWAETARRWMFSTATAQQDTKNLALFDGDKTVRQTFTALPDYMAENHGMVHPSYTASSINFTGILSIVYGAHGKELPKHAFFNRQKIYDQLKRATDRLGYLHPPQGMDWPYLPPDAGSLKHAAAAVLLKDPDGAYLERCALKTLEARLESNGGRLYDPQIAASVHSIQDPATILETNIGRKAQTYLFHRLHGDGPRPTPEAEFEKKMRGVTVYPHSGFVFHRHRTGQTSFAWRNNIMALPLNKDGIYTVAPASNSFLASINVKDKPDSQDQVSIHVDEQQNGFAAALVMNRAQGSVRQEVLFAGLPSGISLSCERLTAQQNITVTNVEQGFLRIINEDFKALKNSRGHRTLYTPEESERFKSYVSTDPASDIIKTYEHPGRINVDNRLAIVFSGSGKTVYHNRHFYKTWWAVADDLTLSRIDRSFRVKSGGQISELTALLAPDCSNSKTAGLSLVTLDTHRSAVGLLADGHLSIANFAAKPANLKFTAKRSELPWIPIFEGSTSVTARSISYTRSLQAGNAQLQKALLGITTDGTLEITASAAGEILARNAGRKQATVQTDRSDKPVKIKPGQIAVLS